MKFKGSDLAVTSIGLESGAAEGTVVLKAQAAFLGAAGESHGYADLEVDTRQLPVDLRQKLQAARDAIEAYMRAQHFEGQEDEQPDKPAKQGPPRGGILERYQGDEDTEQFDQGGGGAS